MNITDEYESTNKLKYLTNLFIFKFCYIEIKSNFFKHIDDQNQASNNFFLRPADLNDTLRRLWTTLREHLQHQKENKRSISAEDTVFNTKNQEKISYKINFKAYKLTSKDRIAH